jgi:hypothetical protein
MFHPRRVAQSCRVVRFAFEAVPEQEQVLPVWQSHAAVLLTVLSFSNSFSPLDSAGELKKGSFCFLKQRSKRSQPYVALLFSMTA